MTIVLWIASGLLGLLGALITLLNGGVFVQGAILRQDTPSWVPLLGGLALTVALLLCPLPGTGRWWWLPLLLDYGCVPGFAHTAWYYWRHRGEEDDREPGDSAGVRREPEQEEPRCAPDSP